MEKGTPYNEQHEDKADRLKELEMKWRYEMGETVPAGYAATLAAVERERGVNDAPRPPGLHHTPPAFEDSVEARAFLERAAEAAAPGVLAKFDETLKSLNKDRGADYGHPYHNFQVMAAFTEGLGDCPDPRLRQALIMIAAKISRLVQNPYHLDSWIDIAGYARTAVMVMDYDDTMDGGNTP